MIEIKLLKFIREADPHDSFYMIRIRNYLYFRKHIVHFPLTIPY